MRGIGVLALVLMATLPSGAADLVEPWEPGFTDLELWISQGEGAAVENSVLAGFGLGHGISAGGSLSRGADGARRVGGILMLTREPGRETALDLWVEVGMETLSREAELGRMAWSLGGELSRDLGRWVPYLRLTQSVEAGEASFHPLLGAMVPFSEGRLELHLELSSEEPAGGPWPVHLALGPNVHLEQWLELLPELSVVRDRGAGRTHVVLTVGLIVDPSRFLGV